MGSILSRSRALARRFRESFSYVGLAVATLFFAESLTPSLLPRHVAVQGILSGVALALGYGVGVFIVWLWLYLGIPMPNDRFQRVGKRITTVLVATVVVIYLWREKAWQNSIRELMEMEPVDAIYPLGVDIIALLTGVLLIAAARGLRGLWRVIDRRISSYVPRRVSYVVTTLVVVVGLLLITNKIVGRLALNAADAFFLELDKVVDEGIEPPGDGNATGSSQSLVAWDMIGRRGKEFIAAGPTRQEISKFWGKDAMQPLRVYVGLDAAETTEERAELALRELIRSSGFDRKVLVVATPTGTGWLDPGAVDTIEYLHAGDTAIVSMQYSYLPSWLTILVDPARSRNSAKLLFDEVYAHWKTLPKDKRPRLYVHGLSLGALGSAASADLFTVFEDPIQGGVWSGPPFPSTVWLAVSTYRNPDSPVWLPKFRDGSMVRFTGRECTLDEQGQRWGPMRFVFIQHASDPMSFFSPDLLYYKPDWLRDGRGPDVSPHLTWKPIVTFLQVGFDLPMATTVPAGYGHNFAPASYIDAWIEVTQPEPWSADDTKRLRLLFSNQKLGAD
jgi:uncharacterized membrane protein